MSRLKGKQTLADYFDPVFCPMMGFGYERYIPAHPDTRTDGASWAPFYTCIANGKRVYVWSYKVTDRGGNCCVMVSSHVSDPAHKAGVAEIQHMFADQHRRQSNIRRTHSAPCDPFLLQAFIHHITLGGNEHEFPGTGIVERNHQANGE